MEARLTDIPRREALRYLGVRGEPDERLLRDLDRCAGLLERTAVPRAVWRIFPWEEKTPLAGTDFRPEGEAIRRHLAGCGRVICLAATLGAESETLLRRTQGTSMADAVLLDALASCAVENVCDNLCADLAEYLAPATLTGRFSPGYGDFPLSQQRELCGVLDVYRQLGVSLTEGGLMIPQKSVTALVGVRPEPFGGGEGTETSSCARCGLAGRCPYQKEGKGCERK